MIQQVQDLFDTNVTKVMDAFPSIYTKDDVVSLLTALRNDTINEIIQNPVSVITEEMFQDFSAEVARKLERSLSDGTVEVYDYHNVELSIDSGNHISIEHIEVDTDSISEELHDIMLREFQNIFGELITTKKD